MTSAEKAWLTVGLCVATTVAIRAFGPMAVGGRPIGPRITRVLALLPPALLAALVVTETVIEDGALDVDARLAGVAAAGLVVWRNGSAVAVVLVAATVTALLRLAF